MQAFLAELFGTLILIAFGDGVVANVLLVRTKGNNSGWLVIATGWGLAVAIAVYATNALSGAHLNPAVTLAMAVLGKLPWREVVPYMSAQMIGAFLGGILVWLVYLPHWKVTADPGAKLGVFCNAPAIRDRFANMVTETVATFLFVVAILVVVTPANLQPNSGFDTSFGPLLIGLIVWAVGLSLGGSTGYAINPARDLGPRLSHAVLPIPGKGNSDWGYSWVPVAGPLLGGLLAALFYRLVWAGLILPGS